MKMCVCDHLMNNYDTLMILKICLLKVDGDTIFSKIRFA